MSIVNQSPKLSCADVSRLAADYIAGRLPQSQQELITQHLGSCADCRAFLEELKVAEELLREAKTPAPPSRLAERIKIAAQTRLSLSPRPLHQRAIGSPVFLATCASLLCAFVICLLTILKAVYLSPWPLAPPPAVSIVATYHGRARFGTTASPPVPTTLRRCLLLPQSRGEPAISGRSASPAGSLPRRPTQATAAAPRAAGVTRLAPALPLARRATSVPREAGVAEPAFARDSAPWTTSVKPANVGPSLLSPLSPAPLLAPTGYRASLPEMAASQLTPIAAASTESATLPGRAIKALPAASLAETSSALP